MKKHTPKPLFCVALVFLSAGTSLKAQQNPVLPSDASSTLNPIVRPSDTQPVFPEGATNVQSAPSLPLTYVPSGRVSANEYYKMLQTTGSYGVNRERSLADQNAAISKAREMRKLKEQIASVRHYRSNFISGADMLETIPPPSPPERPEPGEGTDGSDAPNSGSPEPGNQSPSASDAPQFAPADQVRVPLLQKLINKRRQAEPNPEPISEAENPYDDSATPLPPAPLRQGPDEINAPIPPSGAPVPQFAGLEDAPPPEPAPKKGLFSRFRKNSTPTLSPTNSLDPPEPSAVAALNPPAPPAPEVRSIFRPNSSNTKRNQTYSITGRKVFADVGGAQVKLSQGTKVTLLRSGTSRSLIQLYDKRQATVPNEVLVPDS